MQHQGDRPVQGGRPTLLSPDEQAVPERQGILSSLDGVHGQSHAAPVPRPRARALAWGGAAVGAIVVGGALWLLAGGEEGRTPRTVAAAAPAAATVADLPRAAPVTPVSMAAAASPTPAPAVSTAAVLRDEPVALPEPAAVPEPAGPVPNPLAEMAPAPAPAPARHRERAARADKAERKEAHAKAAHHKTQEKPRDVAREKRTKPRAAREQDSDVVLLAALVSHIEPANRKATPAQQLEACRRYNRAGEAQCRARVCASVGRKEAACKRSPAADTAPDS